MSLVTVFEMKRHPKRVKKPCEVSSDILAVHAFSAEDRMFYEMLTPDVAVVFIKKQHFVQLILGMQDSYHLLNPCYALCHVASCQKLLKLAL